MNFRQQFLVVASVAVLSAAPLCATELSLFGGYWNTDVAGDAAGGGIEFGLPVNETFAFELRATYFEQLNDHPFENIFDNNETVFQGRGIQALPLEAGVRLTFIPEGPFRPYVGGGASYFFLDSDFGDIKDELGWYGTLGATIGDGRGADFYVEGIWRKVRAEVRADPEDLGDIPDINAEDHVSFDLDGFGVNLGVRWSF